MATARINRRNSVIESDVESSLLSPQERCAVMSEQVSEPLGRRHRLLAETRPRVLKADLRKAETSDPWRVQVGRAIARSMQLLGWSLKEFAAAVGREPRQVARWIAGTERPQMDALFSVAALRAPLVQAFAELTGEAVEVETVIRVRRRG